MNLISIFDIFFKFNSIIAALFLPKVSPFFKKTFPDKTSLSRAFLHVCRHASMLMLIQILSPTVKDQAKILS
jgi:hypothetical protein